MFLAQKSVVIIGHTVLYLLDHDCKKTSSGYGESNKSSRFLAEGVTGPTRKWWQFATLHGVSVSDVIDLVFLWYHRTLLIQLQTLAEVEETILYGFRSSSAYGKLLLEEEAFCSKEASQAKERASHQWIRVLVSLPCWWYLGLSQTLNVTCKERKMTVLITWLSSLWFLFLSLTLWLGFFMLSDYLRLLPTPPPPPAIHIKVLLACLTLFSQ